MDRVERLQQHVRDRMRHHTIASKFEQDLRIDWRPSPWVKFWIYFAIGVAIGVALWLVAGCASAPAGNTAVTAHAQAPVTSTEQQNRNQFWGGKQ